MLETARSTHPAAVGPAAISTTPVRTSSKLAKVGGQPFDGKKNGRSGKGSDIGIVYDLMR